MRQCIYVDYSNCRMTLVYTYGRKLNLNRLSPIGLFPGVSLAWSCCLKVVEQMELELMELMVLTGVIRNK